jgi:predicted nucleic-acid-binding Zn-ribbon protein
VKIKIVILMNIEDATLIVKICENCKYAHYIYDTCDYHKAKEFLKEIKG